MMLGEFRIVSPRVGREPPGATPKAGGAQLWTPAAFSSTGETDLDQADLHRFQPFSPLGDVNDTRSHSRRPVSPDRFDVADLKFAPGLGGAVAVFESTLSTR